MVKVRRGKTGSEGRGAVSGGTASFPTDGSSLSGGGQLTRLKYHCPPSSSSSLTVFRAVHFQFPLQPLLQLFLRLSIHLLNMNTVLKTVICYANTGEYLVGVVQYVGGLKLNNFQLICQIETEGIPPEEDIVPKERPEQTH